VKVFNLKLKALDIKFNPRLDLINATGAEKNAYRLRRLKQTSLRSDLAREFSPRSRKEFYYNFYSWKLG
jgi:hypothetical protein